LEIQCTAFGVLLFILPVEPRRGLGAVADFKLQNYQPPPLASLKHFEVNSQIFLWDSQVNRFESASSFHQHLIGIIGCWIVQQLSSGGASPASSGRK